MNKKVTSLLVGEKNLIESIRRMIKETWPLMLLSVLFTFCFHSSDLLPTFFSTWYSWAGVYSMRLILAFWLFWYAVLLLSCLHRWFAWIVLPLLILPDASFILIRQTYGADGFSTIISAIETTWKECSVYFSVVNVAAALALLVCVFLQIYILRRFISPQLLLWCNRRLLTVIFSFVALVIYSSYPVYAYVCYDKNHPEIWKLKITRNHPIGSVGIIIDLNNYYRARDLADPAQFPSSVVTSPLPEAVVLYIGESFRADHSNLNGYSRNTLPLISTTRNIINMPEVYSKGTCTLVAIRSLLSKTEEDTLNSGYMSFSNILKKHGYANYLLVGANTQGKWYESPIIKAILDNKVPFYSNPVNGFGYAQDISTILSMHQNSFLLIEDGAGHIPYESESTVFGNKNTIDKYDNCLLDIDSRLKAIITELENRDALMIFISDHGESFGENGRYCHSGPTTATEQVHVCCFLWYSDLYAQRRPEIIAALKSNANKKWKHDFVYHTIISLSGISSKIQNPNLDISHPQNH